MALLRTLVLTLAVLAPATALAQSAAEQADAKNEAGKRLFADKRYEEAYQQFREAATLSPEGRFFFNMCFALNFLERYADAIQACEQVEPAGADQKLLEKADKALVSLRQKAAAQGGGTTDPGTGGTTDPGTGGTTDPGTGGTTPPQGGGAMPPPGDDPFVTTGAPPPEDDYKWSIGGELTFARNLGLGAQDGFEAYSQTGGGFRVYANFLLNEAQQLGMQGYIGVTNFSAGDENPLDQRINIVDLGGALFLHRKLGGSLYWTPLAGAHISVQQPDELSEGFVAIGVRAELAVSYLFGARKEHALSFIPGLNVYGPASGTAGGAEPAAFALDQPSGSFTLGIGYQYRFATPFGSSPLISLE